MQITARTLPILLELLPGSLLVAVNLPAAGAFAAAVPVFYKALHVLRRTAQKQTDLAGKVLPVGQTAAQLPDAAGLVADGIACFPKQTGRIAALQILAEHSSR